MKKNLFAVLLSVCMFLIVTHGVFAQESATLNKKNYNSGDTLDADLDQVYQKLREAALALKSLKNNLDPRIEEAEAQLDAITPASCNFTTEKLVWDGTKWICTPDVTEELEWYAATSWGACSATCGGGTQTRDVKCRMKIAGTDVGTEYCPALATNSKPTESQSCNTQLCAANWLTGTWSACSATCGGGTRTRSVTCPSGFDCSMYVTPASSESCNTQTCTADWVEGAWGTCSATCGGGTQTRSVTCPAGYSCTATKPATSQSCNTQACVTTGAWTTGSWSAWSTCSKTCGTGTQTRTRSVTCNYTTCTGAQPSASETQNCNTQSCSGTWVLTGFHTNTSLNSCPGPITIFTLGTTAGKTCTSIGSVCYEPSFVISGTDTLGSFSGPPLPAGVFTCQ